MKTRLLIFLAVSTILTNFEVLGYSQPLDPSHSNYVVIGAFAVSRHADVWVRNAKKKNFTAVAAINPNRNLYYVYVMSTGDREVAKSEAIKLQKSSPYWDTWVYSGPLGAGASPSGGSDFHPVTGQAITNLETKDAVVVAQQGQTLDGSSSETVTGASGTTSGVSGTSSGTSGITQETSGISSGKSGTVGTVAGIGVGTAALAGSGTDTSAGTKSATGISAGTSGGNGTSTGTTTGITSGSSNGVSAGTGNLTPVNGAIVASSGTSAGSVGSSSGDPSATNASTTVSSGADPTSVQEKAVVEDPEEGSKNFLFKIFTADDHRDLTGDVDVLDVDRGGRKVASYQGNQNVVIKPINKSGNLSMICDVFGYRKVKVDLNFNRPTESEGIQQEGNQTVVPFGLARLKKGDISVMYNVYFFKDAAVMRPESRSEVNSLLDMMKENTKYKIKIHGHTNGNAHGKVISMGDSKKFFALTDTKEGFGSAKKLSEERAKVIREYLVAEGIDPNRMEIKAWGGKRPAVEDKMSAQAASNVRVEIEILDDK